MLKKISSSNNNPVLISGAEAEIFSNNLIDTRAFLPTAPGIFLSLSNSSRTTRGRTTSLFLNDLNDCGSVIKTEVSRIYLFLIVQYCQKYSNSWSSSRDTIF